MEAIDRELGKWRADKYQSSCSGARGAERSSATAAAQKDEVRRTDTMSRSVISCRLNLESSMRGL
jgi:hypothetical protein